MKPTVPVFFNFVLMLVLAAACGSCSSSPGEADAGQDAGEVAGGDESNGEAAGDETGTDGAEPVLGSISVEELHQALDSGQKDFLLINVHVPREGEIPGTDVHIAYTDVDALAGYIGQKDNPAVLYCKSDAMSVTAGNALVERGYTAIRYLEGGMNAWVAAGYQLDP